MGIGNGLGNFIADAGIASRSINDENFQEGERAFTTAIQNLGLQRARVANELLPLQSAADRARLGLNTAQDTAALPNVQKQADVQGTQLDVQRAQADNMKQHLPILLGRDSDEFEAHANQAKVDLAQSGIAVEGIPSAVHDARTKRLIGDQQAGQMALAGLGYAAATSDDPEKALVDYANKMNQVSPLPGHEGATFTGARVVQKMDPATGKPTGIHHIEFQSDKGPIAVSGEKINDAMNQISPAQFSELRAGATMIKKDRMGNVTEVAHNSADLDRIRLKGELQQDLAEFKAEHGATKTTALQNNMKMLVESGVADDYAEAFQMLHTSVEKSKPDAIQNMATKLMAAGGFQYRGKGGAQKAIDDATRMIEQVRGGTPASPASPAPTSGAPASPPSPASIIRGNAAPAAGTYNVNGKTFTDDDINATAKKYGITPDQVKAKLGIEKATGNTGGGAYTGPTPWKK